MSVSKKKVTPTPEQKQAACDDDEFVVSCLAVLVEAIWNCAMAIARPLCGLVRFVLWDHWRKR